MAGEELTHRRNTLVRPRGGGLHYMDELNPYCPALCCPLICMRGERGWEPGIQSSSTGAHDGNQSAHSDNGNSERQMSLMQRCEQRRTEG